MKKDGSNVGFEKWEDIRVLVNDQVKLFIQKSASKKREGKKYTDFLNLIFPPITELWNSKELMFDVEIEAFIARFKTSFSKDNIKVINPFAN